jgi:hypothetical protein
MKTKAKILVALMVAILSSGLGACAGLQPTSSMTAKNLTGVWHMASRDLYFQLNQDGTYGFGDSRRLLEKSPFDTGQYRLEGTSLIFITSEKSWLCAGKTGNYKVELTEEGQLEFVPQEDPCWERSSGIPSEPWDRVEP